MTRSKINMSHFALGAVAAVSTLVLNLAPADASLLVHYKFDESPSGNTTAVDSSGNGHTGTFSAAPTRDTVDKPEAASLPGNVSSVRNSSTFPSSTTMTSASSPDFASLRSFTATMWLEGTPAGQVYPRGIIGGNWFTAWEVSSNSFVAYINGPTIVTPSYGTLTGWHLWSMAYDGTEGGVDGNGRVTVYIDGTQIYNAIIAGGDQLPGGSAALEVGNDPSFTRVLTNKFDDVRIYGSQVDGSGALSQAQIQALLPEPASLTMLGAAACLVLRRRKA